MVDIFLEFGVLVHSPPFTSSGGSPLLIGQSSDAGIHADSQIALRIN